MRKLKRKTNNLKNIFFNRIFLSILGLLVLTAISIPLARNASKQYTINNEIKELEKEISSLKGKNQDLNNIISYLESDEFAEEQARINLNYKNKDEEMVIIKKSDEKINGRSEPGSKNYDSLNFNAVKLGQGPRINNLGRWWNYFFLP